MILLLWPPNRAGHYILYSSCFFLFSYSQRSQSRRLDVYHTSTHDVALVRIYNAGLKCAAGGSLKIQDATIHHLRNIAQICRTISSQLRRVSTIGKVVEQHYLLHMSSQHGELWPTNAWDRLASLGHRNKFQQVSLRYCTDVAQRKSTKLCTMFGRLMGSYTIYTF